MKSKMVRVCHNCKWYKRANEGAKYSDGICLNRHMQTKSRELFETCSRFSAADGTEYRAKMLYNFRQVLASLKANARHAKLCINISEGDTFKILLDMLKRLIADHQYLIDIVFQTRVIDRSQYEEIIRFYESSVCEGKRTSEIIDLEHQWNSSDD